MWKKDETPEPPTFTRPDVIPTPVRIAPTETPDQRATIGSSITIRGDVTGDEDLLIEGRVEGSVNLQQHSVTVGREGEVKANVFGRVIAVEGRVEGNLKAEEQVILRASAMVEGDIVAPRVVLEDGARFRGGVDMGESVSARGGSAASGAAPASSGATRPVAGAPAQSGRPSSPTTAEAPARVDAGTPREAEASAGKTDGARKTTEVSA